MKIKPTKKFIIFGLLLIASFCFTFFYITYDFHDSYKTSQLVCSSSNQPTVHYNQSVINGKVFKTFQESNVYSSKRRLTNDWFEVIPHIHLYSAFNDICQFSNSLESKSCIKIVAVILRSHSKLNGKDINIYCYIKTEDNTIVKTGPIEYEKLPEDHGDCFVAAFIQCPLPNNYQSDQYPKWVSVNPSLNQLKWIPIHKSEKLQTNDLAMCVRPLYGPFGSFLTFLEFIVYYSIVGVDHFYFYDQDIIPEMFKLNDFISNHSKISITILPWKLSVDSELVHATGQLAHIQDCILRSRNQFKYVVLVDLDEFIVPQLHYSLKEMLYELDKEHTDVGSYVFPMALFCDEYMLDKNEIHSFPFVTHINTNRQSTAWYYHERSKTIVNPLAVKIGGIHFVWQHVEPFKEIRVPEDIAVLHHYKSCCGLTQSWFFHFKNFYVLSDEKTIDNSILRHQETMLKHPLIHLLLKLIS